VSLGSNNDNQIKQSEDVMERILVVAALVFAIGFDLTHAAQAGERKLSAPEIEEALAGNTVDGNWKGTAFKQFFAQNGSTTYVAEGSNPSVGKWKVDSAKDQYCSWWRGTGWDCYEIYSAGPHSIIWVVPGDGYRSPSRLISGNKL
jgi:hypothetical protein